MSTKVWEVGGFLAGALLIAFGAVAIYMGIDGRSTVRDSLKQEGIVFGSAADPAVSQHASQWAGEQVLTGDQARAFALIMREHALESTGGLTYAEMGRYTSAQKPEDPRGTNDLAAAKKDAKDLPVANGARDVWVTATALSTALNMSYMAEQLAIFGIVVGVALLLTGIGLVILAFAVFHRRPTEKEAQVKGTTVTPVTG